MILELLICTSSTGPRLYYSSRWSHSLWQPGMLTPW